MSREKDLRSGKLLDLKFGEIIQMGYPSKGLPRLSERTSAFLRNPNYNKLSRKSDTYR